VVGRVVGFKGRSTGVKKAVRGDIKTFNIFNKKDSCTGNITQNAVLQYCRLKLEP
jgi:hypothetical protein